MDNSNALGGELQSPQRKKYVVVDKRGTMGNLHENVLADASHGLGIHEEIKGQAIVMEQVLAYPGSLGLPVQPQAAGAVMDMVPPNDSVDGGVKLDTADLRADQILLVVDVVDVVVLDQ